MSEEKETQESKDEVQAPVDSHDYDALTTVLPEVIAAFRKVGLEERARLLKTVATFFGIEGSVVPASGVPEPGARTAYSEDRSLSPKEFLRQKQPRTDVERVASLAYYLTHYRDTPQFKTLDLSQLNTEAAQIKFANAAKAVNNAASYGYLSATTKGNKQLTAIGESFVEALPDRELARHALANHRRRKRRRPGPTSDAV